MSVLSIVSSSDLKMLRSPHGEIKRDRRHVSHFRSAGCQRVPFPPARVLGPGTIAPSCPPPRTTAAAPPALRRLFATRYVTALREGGSVPAVVEADDGALYVAKFRAAAQGGRVLAAELIVGELARAAGLRVPELALIDIDAALGRSEPHQEIQELLIASAGTNLAMAYLAGAVGYDVAARRPVDGALASAIVALDLFATNVDRTARNPNLLWCQRRAVADRSRRVAVLAARLGRQRRRRRSWRRRRRARSRARASTCCCRSPTACRRRARRWRRRSDDGVIDRAVAAVPDGVAGRAGRRRAARRLRRLAARAAGGAAAHHRRGEPCPSVSRLITRSCRSCRASIATSASTPA